MWVHRVALLGASIMVSLVLGGSPTVAAEGQPICSSSSRSGKLSVTSELWIDVSKTNYPAITTTTTYKLAATSLWVAMLRQHNPTADEYRGVLQCLQPQVYADRFGGPFPSDPPQSGFYMAELPRVPELRIENGSATLTFTSKDQVRGTPYYIGVHPWAIELRGSELVVTAPAENLPRGRVQWNVMMHVTGATVVNASPTPTSDDGRGEVTWTGPATTTATDKRQLTTATDERQLTASLPLGARTVLTSPASGLRRVPVDMIAMSLLFGILAVVVRRWRRGISSDQVDLGMDLRRLARATSLGLVAALTAVVVNVLAGFATPPIYSFAAGRDRLMWCAGVCLLLVVAAGTCAAAALQPRLEPATADTGGGWALRRQAETPIRMLVAIAALLIIGIVSFAVDSTSSSFAGLGFNYLLVVTSVLALFILVFGALPAVLACLMPSKPQGGSDRRIGHYVGVLLLLVALASILQKIYDAYQQLPTWRMGGGLWEQLSSAEVSSRALVRVVYFLPELARYTVTFAVMLILLIAILTLLWRLRSETAEPASAPSPTRPAALCRMLLVLLFAGFVVGWTDNFVVLSFPLAFILAFVLLLSLLPEPRPPKANDLAGPAASTPEPAASGNASGVDLTAGPKGSSWENAIFAVSHGWRLAIPFVVFDIVITLRAAFQTPQSGVTSVAGLTELLVNDVIFWLAAAFTLGYGYRWLRGRNGVVKGLLLAAVAIAAEALVALVQLRLGQQSGSLWEAVSLRGWSLLLFLAALGAWIDVGTLRTHNLDWTDLGTNYHIERVRSLVGYIAPLLAAVVGVIIQIRSGQTQEAVQQTLENANKIFPPGPGG
jgi:hypothetical protein